MNSNRKLLYYTLVALEIQVNVNYKFYPFLQRNLLEQCLNKDLVSLSKWLHDNILVLNLSHDSLYDSKYTPT